MKIGILTFHCAHNYGAVLQAYALQEFLKSLGHEVEVIDYRPEYLTAGYGAFPLPKLRGASFVRKIWRLGNWGLRLPWRVLDVPVRVRRRAGFEKFISEKMNLSRERFAEGGRVPAENYDAIVFGSDQIWSPAHTNGGDSVFLGDFPASAGTLKIAYAASAGAASATLGENPLFAGALKNFDAVSVREENLAASLRPKTRLEIETVVDPTLLVDREVWEKIAEPPALDGKYVLVYQVAHNPAADAYARELAAQLGAKVVSVWAGYSLRRGMLRTETPEQFVGWFKNAACVVSTSFHGTAFSLIFGRPLYYVGNGNAGENRPKQILGALGLEDRYVLAGTPCPKFSEIDYDDVNKMGGVFLRCRRVPARSWSGRFRCGKRRSVPARFCFGEKAESSPGLAPRRAFSRSRGKKGGRRKMKIGILTQPLHTNYGGLLQAFALQKTLRDMGHEALTVDYTRRPRRWTLPYRFARRCVATKLLLGRGGPLFSRPLSRSAGTHTRRFVEENIRTTRKIFAPARAKDFAAYGFEAFVVGSDQTWRPAYSPHMPTFFLDFLGDDDAETRRVAYAASFGKDTWEEFSPRLTRLCARLAKKFHAISVREDSGVGLCEKFLGVRAEHLLDPTLLLEKADYCDVVARDEARGLLEARAEGTARRLFAYVLDEAAAKSALVREVAGTLGLEVEEIMPSAASRRAGTAVFPPVSAWLRGFRDAEFVVTDSFHGCVFSILFNRPFVAFGNEHRGLSRFHSLLKTFGLESRLVLLGDEGFDAAARERVLRLVREEIDWARVNATLARERARSRAFLESALSPRK